MLLRTETFANENGVTMIKKYYGYVDEKGNEIIKSTSCRATEDYVPEIPAEPSQLDRIESAIKKMAENNVTEEDITAAITSGVNDV